jgi:hypothetical protein
MKIIAAVHIGRNGRQYKPGDSIDVSPAHARMYVLSKQARYPTTEQKPAAAVKVPGKKTPAPPPQPEPSSKQDDTPRKGRHRRRDMRAEGDGD